LTPKYLGTVDVGLQLFWIKAIFAEGIAPAYIGNHIRNTILYSQLKLAGLNKNK